MMNWMEGMKVYNSKKAKAVYEISKPSLDSKTLLI